MIMDRGKEIYKLVSKYLTTKGTVLDYCCGSSQIAKYFIDGEHTYIGFDDKRDIIESMRKKFKKGTFELKSFIDIDYKDIDVLLFLRSSFEDWTTEQLKVNIEKIRPGFIFMDPCLRKREDGNDGWIQRDKNGISEIYIKLNFHLIKLGYKLLEGGILEKDRYYYQIWGLNGNNKN